MRVELSAHMRMVLAALLVPALAHADPPSCKPDGKSYRGTLLLVDALAIGGLAAAFDGDFPGELPLLAYFFGAPLVHYDHCQGTRMAASLSARVLLPAL